MKLIKGRGLGILGFVPLAFSSPALAEYGLNMTRGVTEFSERVYGLHMLILWICVAIGILVFGAMFVSMALHRKSRGAQAADFRHNTKAEIAWTLIPILILVGIAVPATKALVFMEQTTDADMTVKITAYQWKWKYEYKEADISFISTLDREHDRVRQVGSGGDPYALQNYLLEVDRPLVLPVGKKVRFLIGADDVIHSWWVPALGWKRDAIPGFINEAWTKIERPGTYRGQCAELCGKDHGFMPIVVVALEEPAYRAWLDEQKERRLLTASAIERHWSKDELLDRGESVYRQQCATCHQVDGRGLAPGFPALAGNPVAIGPAADHMNVVLHGRPGTAMQAFGQILDEIDIAAALTYTRNAWGNDSGDSIQPTDVRQAKRGRATQEAT